jgi:uncharacterized protein YoxC
MKNQQTKTQIAKTVVSFALMGLAAVVLIRLFKTAKTVDATAKTFDVVGKNLQQQGLRSLL